MGTPPRSGDRRTHPVDFPGSAVTTNISVLRGTASALSTGEPSQPSTLVAKLDPFGYNVITYSPRLPVLIYVSSRLMQPPSRKLSVLKPLYRIPIDSFYLERKSTTSQPADSPLATPKSWQ
jgi:hypothetical protein